MKKTMCCLACMMVAGMSGLAMYAFMNKDTKKKADELLNTMMEDATDCMKEMR